MEIVVALVIVAVLAWLVTAPLRGDRGAYSASEDPREAELDREEGKLTVADWRLVDAELRREAIELLREIDALEAARGDG